MSRILIVEDSPTQAAYVRAILEEAGHVVTTAVDGSQALALFEEEMFELVLSDVNMPGMSGYELCAELRQNPATQQLPIILLTSRNDPMAIVRGLECGADNFITKPYDPAYLLERVRTILEAKRNRQGKLRVGVDITFLGRKFVITSEKEQILDLLLSTFEEIVRTNADLEARTEELNSVLESIGDGVVVTDTAGKLILHNHTATTILGPPPPEKTIDAWLSRCELVCAERGTELALHEFPVVYALRGQTREDVEMVRRDAGEASVTISMSARPMRNGAGQVRGAVLVVRDITQRKAAEALLSQQARELSEAKERAEQESRYKSRFLANMSHELRTPLNAVLGFAELLGQELFGTLNPRQKQYVSYITQGGEHLLALVNDVLDISKIEANKLDLVPEWLDPKDLINAACSVVRPLAEKKNVRIEQELAEELPRLWADPVRIKQVLYNLLSNAVKFTPEGGVVTLAAYVDAPHFKLQVRDTGVGISREDMPRLFREFEQIEQPSGRKSEGAGLGLALTKRLVLLHQGVISVESEPGRGSSFEVSLPLSPQAPAQSG